MFLIFNFIILTCFANKLTCLIVNKVIFNVSLILYVFLLKVEMLRSTINLFKNFALVSAISYFSYKDKGIISIKQQKYLYETS